MKKIQKIGILVLILTEILVNSAFAQLTVRNIFLDTMSLPMIENDYKMIFYRIENHIGIDSLPILMTDRPTNFPLFMVKQKDAIALVGTMERQKQQYAESLALGDKIDNLNGILDEKNKIWADLDSMQNIRITNLKKHNQELMEINTALSEQVKSALTTAK